MKSFSHLLFLSVFFLLMIGCKEEPVELPDFMSAWPQTQRTFIGPEYWSNRLQDWQVNNGRIECLVSNVNRNTHLLTWEVNPDTGSFEMQIRAGLMNEDKTNKDWNWFGFRVGINGEFNDYRDNAIYGKGMDIGVTAGGNLFIGDPADATSTSPLDYMKEMDFKVKVESVRSLFSVTFSVHDPITGKVLESITRDSVLSREIAGNIALVSHFEDMGESAGKPSVWFADWIMDGNKLIEHPDRAYGPIMFSHYTLSKKVMKMTAQLGPTGEKDGKTVTLQVQEGENWKTLGEASINKLARTATFKIAEWDDSQDVPYRLVYQLYTIDNQLTPYYWEGTIRKDPVNKKELVVAGFTGNNDLGFPNKDLTDNVVLHDPDILFFSGDQIYEGVGGYGVQRSPVDKAALDYLRKWYLFGWTYRDLMKDRPSISIPDDHDVYHGNIWGEGGKQADQSLTGSEAQDTGGYKMNAEWVKMVERTQTAHLPDPYDPTKIQQGIGVYYTDMIYGGVSFAIIEDRKFKSAPKALLPDAEIHNGWAQNRDYDAKTQADHPDAVLLGQRQLDFLDHWAADWTNGEKMKVLLSQTIFANVATLPEEEFHDKIVPKLRILNEEEYAPNDRPVSDMDSNGWPQTGRNKALKAIRRGFAFHIAGDQHLGSMIQYGVDEYNDAPFAFCVPAVSNVWPRRWYPQSESPTRIEGEPKYTGDYEDGFGNKMTVHAVSNPVFTGRKPARLYDRATGYGIVRLDRQSRDITIECWPRDINPKKSGAKQYPGWPITINQMDNYSRNAGGWLPTIETRGLVDPVIQVLVESTGEVVYTVRMKGDEINAKVFELGTYTVKIGSPDKGNMQTIRGIKAVDKKGGGERMMVKF